MILCRHKTSDSDHLYSYIIFYAYCPYYLYKKSTFNLSGNQHINFLRNCPPILIVYITAVVGKSTCSGILNV